MSGFPDHVTWKSYQLKASILAGEVIQFCFFPMKMSFYIDHSPVRKEIGRENQKYTENSEENFSIATG